ncbi:UNVERIFIED_CONTAM: hypothetical protein Slati_0146400 [Sesamum latifolium]|uniref:Glycine-rich protein n=1 Tax=Sesamum latifolium TaxID=2727402 RepID=A0AAW2Y9X9_9LAMI
MEGQRMEDLSYGPWFQEIREVRFSSMMGGYGHKGGGRSNGFQSSRHPINGGWQTMATLERESPGTGGGWVATQEDMRDHGITGIGEWRGNMGTWGPREREVGDGNVIAQDSEYTNSGQSSKE